MKGGGGEELRVATEEAALTDKENGGDGGGGSRPPREAISPKAALLDRAQLTSVRASIAAIQVKRRHTRR